MLLASFLVGVAAAACPDPAAPTDIDAKNHEVQVAFDGLDAGAMTSASDQAARLLPCVGVALPPRTAAGYLRARGLLALYGGDTAGAPRYFASARLADPSWQFTEEQAPNGGPLSSAYGAMSVADVVGIPVNAPNGITYLVNGERRPDRPPGVPLIVQVQQDGAIVRTQLVAPEDRFPDEVIDAARRGRPGVVVLGLASAAVLGTGIGLYADARHDIGVTCGGYIEGCNAQNTTYFETLFTVSPVLMAVGGTGLGLSVILAATPGKPAFAVQGRW